MQVRGLLAADLVRLAALPLPLVQTIVVGLLAADALDTRLLGTATGRDVLALPDPARDLAGRLGERRAAHSGENHCDEETLHGTS
jgi:hypothetical protein